MKDSWQFANPGSVLPGCSVPVFQAEQPDGSTRFTYAFQGHSPWPEGALNQSQQARLIDGIKAVLRGLDKLHRAGIFYGRISKQTFCDRGQPGKPEPMIFVDPNLMAAEAEVSGGHGEERFWLPDRIQNHRAPNSSDDLHALGVVLAGLLLGATRMDSIWNAEPDKSKYAESLSKNLRRSSAKLPLKNLASWLLSSGQHPDRKAIEGIGVLQAANRKRAIMKYSIVGILGFCGLGYWLWSSNAAIVSANEKSQDTAALLLEREEEVTRRDERIRELKSQLRAAESNKTVEPTFVPAGNPGRDLWDSRIAGDSVHSTLANAVQQIQSADPDDADAAQQWLDELEQVADQNPHIDDWFKSDRGIREQLKLAINRPWEADFVELRSNSTALVDAQKTWQGWAKSSKSFDDLSRIHSRMPGGFQKDVLGKWLNEVESLTSLKLQFTTGTAETPSGNGFKIWVDSNGSANSREWIWRSESESGNPLDLTLENYSPGAPLKIWLGQAGYIYNSYMIEVDLGGPLVPWRLSGDIRLIDSSTGFGMTARSLKTVGPPHLKSLPKRAKNTAGTKRPGGKKNSVDDRPVYDPVSNLVE